MDRASASGAEGRRFESCPARHIVNARSSGGVPWVELTSRRASAVLGIVGAGGIGNLINVTRRFFQYDKLMVVVIEIFILVIIVEWISVWLRRRRVTRAGAKRPPPPSQRMKHGEREWLQARGRPNRSWPGSRRSTTGA